jgi:HEAT repeat protein
VLIKIIEDKETKESILLSAVAALGAIGPNAKKAVPTLTKLINRDPIVGRLAINSLGQIGIGAREAVPTLREALKTEQNVFIREEINKAISLIEKK